MIEAALAHHQAGRFAEAITRIRAVLWSCSPGTSRSASNLGAALAHEGRYEEAIAQYRKALAIDGTKATIRLNLAMALYKAFELTEAAQELEVVLGSQADNKNARLLLADCYLRMGQFKKVVATMTPLEPTAAQDRAVAYLMGMALILDEQPARGQVFIDHILRDGESAEARLLMGVARLMALEPAAAPRRFRPRGRAQSRAAHRAWQPGPGPHATGGLGPRPLGVREGTRRSNPNDYDANLYLGVILRQRQQYPEAMSRFRRALSVRPGSATALYQVGSLHLVLGEIEEARKALETVVATEPKFVEAHVSLATVYYRLKRKEDGDKERTIVKDLNQEIQATQPGAKEELGPAYRGDAMPAAPASQDKKGDHGQATPRPAAAPPVPPQ